MRHYIYIQATDADTGQPLAGVSIAFVPLDNGPKLQGGITGLDGKFTRDYSLFFPGVSFYLYTIVGTKTGYRVREVSVQALPFSDSYPILNMQVAPLDGVTSSGLPALVSVGSPPTITLSGLPYNDYAYVETTVISNGDESIIETAVEPDGTCEVYLTDRFRISPFPSLVFDEDAPLLDSYLRRDYTVSCALITGAIRRPIDSYSTTALLIDHPSPVDLVGQWWSGDTLTVARGAYADVTILLPAGTFSIDRAVGDYRRLPPLPVTADGKTPIRVRIPFIEAEYASMTMQVDTPIGAPVSTLLTINFRD